jgi:hypothetical protein
MVTQLKRFFFSFSLVDYPKAFLPSLSKLIHSFRILEGLSDDDLRESAYEILLASLAFSG